MANSQPRIGSPQEQKSTRHLVSHPPTLASNLVKQAALLQEETFHGMLTLERRRAERSRNSFVLMLLDAGSFVETESSRRLMAQVVSVLLKSTRETDLVGWYKNGLVLGVIFTETSPEFEDSIGEILRSKIVNALHDELSHEATSNLVVTVHLFPESRDGDGGKRIADSRLYPDLSKGNPKKEPTPPSETHDGYHWQRCVACLS